MFVRIVAAASVVLGCIVPVLAQGPRPPRGGGPQLEPFEGEGLIEGLAPGKMQIVTNANQRCMVLLTQRTKVEYTGTGTVEALRPGMCVRFTATMDKQGVVKEKVAQLTVFTPTPQDPLGFWSAAEGAPAAGEAPAGKPPAGDVPAGGDPFGFGKQAEKPAGKTPGKPAGKAAAEAGSYLIAGRITSYRAGKLQLTTGNAAIKADVASDAQVELKLADYSLARQGDRVTVSGQTIPKSGLVQAASVKIASVEPLGAKVKPSKPAKEPRTPKKTTHGKEAAAP